MFCSDAAAETHAVPHYLLSVLSCYLLSTHNRIPICWWHVCGQACVCVVFVHVFMCLCSTDTCWNSLLIIRSFSRQLLEPKWVLGFDLVYKEWRSIIIWRRIVEEEPCREEGTDFSKGRKTKKTSFRLDQSGHIRLKCQTCEADAWCLSGVK